MFRNLKIIAAAGLIVMATGPAFAQDTTEAVDTTARGGVKAVIDRITAEEIARAAADAQNQSDINAEAATRAADDGTLQSNIDAEATTRAAGDSTLQDQIDAGTIGGLSSSCLDGQVAKFDEMASAWFCADDVGDSAPTGNPCVNANDPDDEMVLVAGRLCVDKYRASVFSLDHTVQYGVLSFDYPCPLFGTNCDIVARSLFSATASTFLSFYQAVEACENAGKRPLTFQEGILAFRGGDGPLNIPSEWGVEELADLGSDRTELTGGPGFGWVVVSPTRNFTTSGPLLLFTADSGFASSLGFRCVKAA